MGPAFSKLMTKQSNITSAPENIMQQYTIEDMEFDATVISSETETKPDLKTDVSVVDPEVASEPVAAENPEYLVKEVEEHASKVEEKVIEEVPVEEVPVEKVIDEVVIEDKKEKKEKREKRKKLRKDSL